MSQNTRLRAGGSSFALFILHAETAITIMTIHNTIYTVVYHNLTNFGFMEAVLRADMQILLIIGRDSMYPASQPKHHWRHSTSWKTLSQNPANYMSTMPCGTQLTQMQVCKLTHNNTTIISILSLTLAGRATHHHVLSSLFLAGINVFGLFKRSNIDGSESETVTRLIDNLRMNEGREIRLEPGKKLHIKVRMAYINLKCFESTLTQIIFIGNVWNNWISAAV